MKFASSLLFLTVLPHNLIHADDLGYCYFTPYCSYGDRYYEQVTEEACKNEVRGPIPTCAIDLVGARAMSWKEGDIDSTEECINFNVRRLAGCHGEPHFKTWGGKRYDYHGECDLVLIHAPDMDMDIHIRTKIRYNYSYIQRAAVRIGEEVLEVASWGEFVINGVVGTGTDIPTKFAGLEMIGKQLNDKQHSFEIKLDDTNTITLKTFKDWVNVNVDIGTAAADRLGNSLGLMGSFLTGDMLARDGVTVLNSWNETVTDPNIFADEWQVRDTDGSFFLSSRSPQYPEKCILPAPKQTSRRLGESVAKVAAEKACAHWAPQDKDMCVYDVMITGDFDIAAAGSY